MNFELDAELSELRSRVRELVTDEIIPNEAEIVRQDQLEEYELLRKLQDKAKSAGLFVPHLPKAVGGLGLGIMGMCVLFREMGRSPVGARVFNCDAPDQGNMDLILRAGSDAQKKKYLEPLAKAEITSAFCMTEPAPGAGADPTNLVTVAEHRGDRFVINGHKWYSTGGGRAAFLILMARTSDDPKRGATMFLVDRNAKGVEHVRDIEVMADPLLAHREAEMRFTNVEVGEDAVLGEVGMGFQLAQERLVPARLTHCMRWLGLCDRTLELSKEYIATRKSFGKELVHHQLIQRMLAENATAIHAGNLMTFHCAWLLERADDPRQARTYSSMAKLHVARLLCQVLDDAIQMHGARGYSDDMPFAKWYRFARAARIADGPDEVHQVVIARDYMLGRANLLV